MALTGSFALRIGTPMALALSDGVRTVHVSGEVPQTALRRPSTVEDTAERLKKDRAARPMRSPSLSVW